MHVLVTAALSRLFIILLTPQIEMRTVSVDQTQHIGGALLLRMRRIMPDFVRLVVFIQYPA